MKRKWEESNSKQSLLSHIKQQLNVVREFDAPQQKKKKRLVIQRGKWFSYQIEEIPHEQNSVQTTSLVKTTPRQEILKQLNQIQELTALDQIMEETMKAKAKIQQTSLDESILTTLKQKFPSFLSTFTTNSEPTQPLQQSNSKSPTISSPHFEKSLYLPQSIVTYISKFLPVFDWIRASHVCRNWYISLWNTKGSITNFVLHNPNSCWQSNFTFYLFFKQYEFRNEIRSMRALAPTISRDDEEDTTFEVLPWKSSSLPLFKASHYKDGMIYANQILTSMDWCIEVEALFDEYHVSKLKLFYPNLVELELSSRIKLVDCFKVFPNLQKLSLLYIEDHDIQNFKSKHLPLKKLRILENDHMSVLHFVCFNFPNLEEFIIKDVFDYESSIEFETNAAPVVSKKLIDIPVPSQMRILKMEGEAFQNGTIYKDFVSRFKNLEALYIDCYEGDEEGEENTRLNDEILEVLRNNANISKLEISGLYLTQSLFDTICDTYGSHLSYLNLKIHQRLINEKIKQLANCKEVKLTHNEEDSTVIRNTTKCLQTLQHSIEKLTLDGSYKLAYSQFSKLRTLKLSGKIYSELKIHSNTLQVLDISEASLSLSCELVCANLGEFRPSSEISSLKIQSNMLVHIGDSNLPYCTKYIISSPLLETFVLPDIIEVISLQCPLLRKMDLSKEALFSLFDAQNMSNPSIPLTSNPLETVDLSFLDQIKSIRIKSSKFESVTQLCQTLCKFTHLEEILFDECEFTEPMLRYFAEEFTALQSLNNTTTPGITSQPTNYMITKIDKWLEEELKSLQTIIATQFSTVRSLRFHRIYRFHFPMRLFCHLFPHLQSLSIDNWTLEMMHNIGRVSLETSNFWSKVEEGEDKRWKELTEFIFDDTGPGLLMDIEMIQQLMDYLMTENPIKKLILMLPYRTFASIPENSNNNSTATVPAVEATQTQATANTTATTTATMNTFNPTDVANHINEVPNLFQNNGQLQQVFTMLQQIFSRTSAQTYSLHLKPCATLQKLETNVNIKSMQSLPQLDHLLVTTLNDVQRIANESDFTKILQLVQPQCPQLKYFHLCTKFYPILSSVVQEPQQTPSPSSMKESMIKYVTLLKESMPQVEYMSTYVSDQSIDCTVLSFELRAVAPNLEMNIKPKFKYNSEIRNRYGRMRHHHHYRHHRIGDNDDDDDFSDDEGMIPTGHPEMDIDIDDDESDMESDLSDEEDFDEVDFDEEDFDEMDDVEPHTIVIDDDDHEDAVILISSDEEEEEEDEEEDFMQE